MEKLLILYIKIYNIQKNLKKKKNGELSRGRLDINQIGFKPNLKSSPPRLFPRTMLDFSEFFLFEITSVRVHLRKNRLKIVFS